MEKKPEIGSLTKDPLAQPIELNGVQIKNRLVKSATEENMADERGLIKESYLEYYKNVSAGGAGLLITGHMYVNINGRAVCGMAGADLDEQIPKLHQVTDIVHKNGAVIFAQLNHAGLKALPEKTIQKHIVSPSKTRNAAALTTEEIEGIIEAFGRSAVRVKKAGFDGIQIHGAHTYLIAQFLSKWMNRRHDQYGGSLQNRQRFCLEVYQKIRDEVGRTFPVIIKLDSYSSSYASMPPLVPLINVKEALNTAKQLEEAGIDAIEVSCGFNATRGAMPYRASIRTMLMTEGKRLQAAAANVLLSPVDVFLNRRSWFTPNHNIKHIRMFKHTLKVPILGGSCFRDPSYMRRVIRQREADMICMCRPLVYDPKFPKEILSGSDASSGCINCNLCMFMLPSGLPLKCYYGKPPSIEERYK
jgi:2,4-dienoyl-CoA reductase-like NADH-dependent reductase (Old Yellow Enzyme family)